MSPLAPPPTSRLAGEAAWGASKADTFDGATFCVNPHPRVHELSVGNEGNRVVVVDDFYLYPDRVLELVERVAFEDEPRVGSTVAGRRGRARADLAHLDAAVATHFGDDNLGHHDAGWLNVQGLWGNTPLTDRQRVPHIDPGAAGLIYLNRQEDCAGGTGFYRHRRTGRETIPLRSDDRFVEWVTQHGYAHDRLATRADYLSMIERTVFDPATANADGSMLNEGNHHWELMDLVEMRSNRLVIYDGRIPHTMYLIPGTFETVPRFVQSTLITYDSSLF